jgi:hypothetical protein
MKHPKHVPLSRHQCEILQRDDQWKLFEIPREDWNNIPGLSRVENTFAVMGSADPNDPRLLNMIKRSVAGFDQLVFEPNPKPGETEGNAYHFVIQESGHEDCPYILHGPFYTEARVAHHFEAGDLDHYNSGNDPK